MCEAYATRPVEPWACITGDTPRGHGTPGAALPRDGAAPPRGEARARAAGNGLLLGESPSGRDSGPGLFKDEHDHEATPNPGRLEKSAADLVEVGDEPEDPV